MATTVSAKYLGDLRVECTHLQSGTVIVTDAPTDNQGKGEAFSPTDLCAAALAACAVTIIGMYGKNHNVNVDGMEAAVTKVMASNPRRIQRIEVIITMPDREYSEKEKSSIEHAAHSCPVHASLHQDMEQRIVFKWMR
ncbi:MAG: OsmC family protein [Desulfovibrionaceae bacterium]|nr:OsmC family protein [Desulfovibrionaceae bacterium]